MEHRLGTRRAVRTAVVLCSHGGTSVLAQTREVSISGMFVEAPAALLAAREVIDVEMSLPVTTGSRTFRWRAMVVRKTAAGVGLMFDRLRPPAISRLLVNLDARRGQSSHAEGVRTTMA
jgi:hypothetical protein